MTANASDTVKAAGVHENATVEKYFIWFAMLLRCDTSALLVMVERLGSKIAGSLKNEAGHARKRRQITCFAQ
jgi:hypothetical protein